MNIYCEHPVVIYNPKIKSALKCGFDTVFWPYEEKLSLREISMFLETGRFSKNFFYRYELLPSVEKRFKDLPKYVYEKKNYFLKMIERDYHWKFNDLYHSVYNYSYEDLQRFYLLNSSTGETIPLLLFVPCNHCRMCKYKKTRQWSVRALMEESVSENLCAVTLTFNQEYLPENKYDLSEHTDIFQKFIKRLRQDLKRDNYDFKFRYFAVSEFGGKYGRLHYHVLFFNIPSDLLSFKNRIANPYYGVNGDFRKTVPLFHKYVQLAWSDWQKQPFGFIYTQVANTGSSKYILKYTSKLGKARTRYWRSMGFGSKCIDESASYIVENLLNDHPLEDFPIVKKDGQVYNVPMYKYVIDRVVPGLIQTLSADFRSVLFDIQSAFFYLDSIDYTSDNLEYLREKFNTYYGDFCELLGYTSFISDDLRPLTAFRPYELVEKISLYIEILFKKFAYDKDVLILSHNLRKVQTSTVITDMNLYDVAQEIVKIEKEYSKYSEIEKDNQ